MKKLTSDKWLNLVEYQCYSVINPDGWDRSNLEFSFYKEEITEAEFLNRIIKSTILINHDRINLETTTT